MEGKRIKVVISSNWEMIKIMLSIDSAPPDPKFRRQRKNILTLNVFRMKQALKKKTEKRSVSLTYVYTIGIITEMKSTLSEISG